MASAPSVASERSLSPSIGEPRLCIDNTWVDPFNASFFETLNPATGVDTTTP